MLPSTPPPPVEPAPASGAIHAGAAEGRPGGAPLISVVTIFLNAQRFIREAIESVLAQTYDPWELLLVDDGSSDGSTAIARKFAQRYPGKIHYLEHEGHANRGKSISRNLGIRHARGEYVTFLDADDVFLPQKLQRHAAILDAHPEAAMVYGATEYWHSWNGNPRLRRFDVMGRLGVQPDRLYDPPRLLTRFLQDPGVVPCLCGLLARRTVVERIEGFEEIIAHLYEDQVFLAKICLQAPVFVASGCWERYRQHPDSSSYLAIRAGEYHPVRPNPGRLTFLNWLSGYVSKQDVEDADLRKALQKALGPYRSPTLHRLVRGSQQLLRLPGALKRRAGRVKQRMAPRAAILMYHRVGEAGADPWAVCVTPNHLVEQLEVLRRHTRPMSLDELVQRYRNGSIPRRTVVVTFDDGYADNLHNAKRLLERYDIPATVFLTTGTLGATGEFWWDELERLLLQPAPLPESLSLNLDGSTYEWQLGPAVHDKAEDSQGLIAGRPWEARPGTRLALYYSVWQQLLPLGDGARREALDQLRTWAPATVPARATHRPLSIEEVSALEAGGLIDAGAHTVTHAFLPAHSAAFQREEIGGSKAALEKILGRPVTSFAYPHGAYVADTVAAVREAGFACACSDVTETVRRYTDPFQLPRFAVPDWNGDEFAMRLSRWFAS